MGIPLSVCCLNIVFDLVLIAHPDFGDPERLAMPMVVCYLSG